MKETITVNYGSSAVSASVEAAANISDYVNSVSGSAGTIEPTDGPALASNIVHASGTLEFDIANPVDGVSENLSTTRIVDAYGTDDAVVLIYTRERARVIGEAYRDAIRGLANIGAQIESGAIVLPSGVSSAKYLSDLAYAIVNAFPNTN